MFSTATPTSTSVILLLGLVNVLVLAVCVAVFRARSGRQRRRTALLTSAIRDYFRRSGVEVSVACARLDSGSPAYTAFIESEPMKRFRLSHIIEMTLREHVSKTCGMELDKIYWRFPLKELASPNPATEKPAAKDPDTYINEGLVYYRDLPKGDVQEVTWEKFEEFSTKDATADDKPATPQQTH